MLLDEEATVDIVSPSEHPGLLSKDQAPPTAEPMPCFPNLVQTSTEKAPPSTDGELTLLVSS